ncbi:hypothetical protein B7435_27665 [Mycolicibacterium peregrinum]|nr:hypothetical protein AWC21_02910 [Mycolicibacterium peregrinum]OWL96734.1 hypothetical protein B7435_27665 [Mycolicibacterium peregrinum]
MTVSMFQPIAKAGTQSPFYRATGREVETFRPASHAGAAMLSELSTRMDELVLSALAELAAPKPRSGA